MAVDKKISQLTSLAQGDVDAALDVLPIVDTSANETKKITVTALVSAGATAGISGAVLTNGTINSTTIGATTPSTGAFTTLSASGNFTLSGGTANGVLYLNGSKVATSGSALTFDGTNLTVANGDITIATNGKKLYTNYIANNSGVNLNFDSANFLFNTGNVGINTTPSGYLANKVVISTGTDSNNGITIASATNRNGSIWFADGTTGDQAYRGGVDYQHTTDTLYLYSGGQGNLQLNSSGNLGLGVTPSAWSSSYRAISVGFAGGQQMAGGVNNTQSLWTANLVFTGTGATSWKLPNNVAGTVYEQYLGVHKWFNAPANGVNGDATLTQAMALDASGNLLVGTTSSTLGRLEVVGGTGIRVNEDAAGTKVIQVRSAFAGGDPAINVSTNHALAFNTNNTERARISAGGYFKASNDGTYQGSTSAYHELRTSAADYSTIVGNTNASPYGAYILFGNADPNNTTNLFLLCNAWNGTANVTRATIRSNGGLANYQANDVNLSDQRVKKDIKPLGSMWDKFKALEIVTFKYKDQTHDDDNIGVIAQQVESVAPEFIDTDGFGKTPEGEEPLKTVYTTDMYHAAIKALQEAMARIEQLEAKVAAMESK